MNEKITPLLLADLAWNGQTPIAPTYGDVYFSVDDGLAESQHHFLDGVALTSLWQNKDHVTIAETGFGTGLNFLSVWKQFRAEKPSGTLTFISVEKHPLSADALQACLTPFDSLAPMSAKLIERWPPPSNGFHQRVFDGGRVRLLLLFGDAATMFSALEARVDAWFLDGFSPAKNPAMWSPALFTQMARLSAPKARVATFTAARSVLDGLSDVGFTVEKTQGYGRKRHRIIGVFEGEKAPPIASVWSHAQAGRAGDVIVIGGGIAGAATAAALKNMGRKVRVIESPDAHRASSVPVAILSPRFIREAGPRADYLTASFSHALSYPDVQKAMLPPTGLTLHPTPELNAVRMQDLADSLNWPENWIKTDGNSHYFAKSGTLDSQPLICGLLDGVERIEETVKTIDNHGDHWRISCTSGVLLKAANVVIAAGMGCNDIAQTAPLALIPNRGQVGLYPAHLFDQFRDDTLSFGGYLSPAFDHDGVKVRLAGSSFAKWNPDDKTWGKISNKDRTHYLDRLRNSTGLNLPENCTPSSEWAGLRATTNDQYPIVGAVPDWQSFAAYIAPYKHDTNIPLKGPAPYQRGLFVVTGMGSKGFQHAFLAGQVIAAMITDTPHPISHAQEAILSPARFLVRKTMRGN